MAKPLVDGAGLRRCEQALLALTSEAIGHPSDCPSLDEEEYEQLFVEACRQNVAALVATTLKEPPLNTKLKFAALTAKTAAQYDAKERALAELLLLFNNHGISTVLLKGFATSRHWQQPKLRSFGDIDIYQFGQQKEADRLVCEALHLAVDNRTHHHSKYIYRGILVENHYDLIPRYGHRGNALLERFLKQEVAKGLSSSTLHGHPCMFPSPTFEVLFALRHMAAHFAADCITVRHLVDYALICRDQQQQVDWEWVADVARLYGFLPFAMAVEALCRELYGLQLHVVPDTALAHKLLGDIFSSEARTQMPPAGRPLRRLRYKWRRLRNARWKHALCYPAPWGVDLVYALAAKAIKPHTILH